MAQVTINNDWNLPAIAAAAGQADVLKRRVVDDVLFVEDVEQAALDAAVATYDHAAFLAERQAKVAEASDEESDRQNLLAQASAMLAAIQTDIDALAGATTAERWQIVLRTMQRQKRIARRLLILSRKG